MASNTAHLLALVRHANAADGTPDVARVLSARGRGDAAAIGRWLREHDAVPELAVVSPAVRARQTWELAAGELDAAVEVRVDERVYAAGVHDLLAVVASCDDSVRCLALVGHNPAMHALALRLVGPTEQLLDFPTATVALIEVDGGWSLADSGAATLMATATCRS